MRMTCTDNVPLRKPIHCISFAVAYVRIKYKRPRSSCFVLLCLYHFITLQFALYFFFFLLHTLWTHSFEFSLLLFIILRFFFVSLCFPSNCNRKRVHINFLLKSACISLQYITRIGDEVRASIYSTEEDQIKNFFYKTPVLHLQYLFALVCLLARSPKIRPPFIIVTSDSLKLLPFFSGREREIEQNENASGIQMISIYLQKKIYHVHVSLIAIMSVYFIHEGC